MSLFSANKHIRHEKSSQRTKKKKLTSTMGQFETRPGK